MRKLINNLKHGRKYIFNNLELLLEETKSNKPKFYWLFKKNSHCESKTIPTFIVDKHGTEVYYISDKEKANGLNEYFTSLLYSVLFAK